ncbi:MAG: dihydropteroate synthase [Acidimicrobiia bacterium]|nr:dihydropteroate synthase [Actinomycetota bacterium]MBL6923799.1 dihydropteroate synthase [Acidimicrobiia bacterium]MBL6925738.1 dihydropteroate synthase [Acidimicrobiia bacterium]
MIVELGVGNVRDISHRALVMGILNRTPDSFYDNGRFWDFDDFLVLADRHMLEGADILDVGGVRAGPGPEVTASEELSRTCGAVEALSERFDVPIAIDTFRGEVAEAAFEAGACIGNDISGFADPTYLPACARHGAAAVATHVRLGPRIPDPKPVYRNLLDEVAAFLAVRAGWAEEAGVPANRIMVDAGLDLGKTPEMSAALLRSSDQLVSLGYPVFLSASNKGFLGELVDAGVDARGEATWAAHALGIGLGCRIVRTHDVRGARRVSDVMAALLANRVGVSG